MKKFRLLAICVFLIGLPCFGQNQKVPIKVAPKKTAQAPSKQPLAVQNISETEWSEIVKAFNDEDWDKSLRLVSLSQNKLKAENANKELARLRYLHLYSLAGKVVDGKATYDDLAKYATPMIGKEFLMPSREISTDCVRKLNYICPVAGNDKALRVSAINKSATSIITFDYIIMIEKLDVAANSGKQLFLSGKLKKVELNPTQSTIWIMRLFFENGVGLLIKK